MTGSLAGKSDVPVPTSVEFSSDQARLTIIRVASHPFLSRHDLRLTLGGPVGYSSETEWFSDAGYVSRRNLYHTRASLLYVVGQFDARVEDSRRCTITLAKLCSLDSQIISLGSFVERKQKQWSDLPASDRQERLLDKSAGGCMGKALARARSGDLLPNDRQ